MRRWRRRPRRHPSLPLKSSVCVCVCTLHTCGVVLSQCQGTTARTPEYAMVAPRRHSHYACACATQNNVIFNYYEWFNCIILCILIYICIFVGSFWQSRHSRRHTLATVQIAAIQPTATTIYIVRTFNFIAIPVLDVGLHELNIVVRYARARYVRENCMCKLYPHRGARHLNTTAKLHI